MIHLNKISRKLILLQRNELLSNYQKVLRKRFGRYIFTNCIVNFFQKENLETLTNELFKKEFQTFENILPSNINSVLDIGCGLGIVQIFFYKKYKNDLKFFMLDKDKIDKNIRYGFNENYESYNDLSETKNLLRNNGIPEKQIFIKDVDKPIDIDTKIDFVLSLKSMGYHYPIEKYFELFKKVCTKETEFVFDITSGQYNYKIIENYFNQCQIIFSEDSLHPLKRLYCKGFKFI